VAAEQTSARRITFPRVILAAGIAACAVLALAACEDDSPVVSGPAPTVAPSGTSTPNPIATFDPNGNAEDNLAYFQKVGHDKIGTHPDIMGKTIIDDLVAAGFNKSEMEITPDKTSIGLTAWNIEFAIRMKGTCLIGQSGNVGFNATIQPMLSTGKCLIDSTRKIDW
jgi:hypothetical protein